MMKKLIPELILVLFIFIGCFLQSGEPLPSWTPFQVLLASGVIIWTAIGMAAALAGLTILFVLTAHPAEKDKNGQDYDS